MPYVVGTTFSFPVTFNDADGLPFVPDDCTITVVAPDGSESSAAGVQVGSTYVFTREVTLTSGDWYWHGETTDPDASASVTQVGHVVAAVASAVDLTPVLDAIADVPTAAENAIATWINTTRTLTSLPAGSAFIAALNQRTKIIQTVYGDSASVAAGTQIDFPWSGWYADADTVTITARNLSSGTVHTYEGTNPADRVARLVYTAEESEDQVIGTYEYSVTLVNGTDRYTPYNQQKWIVAETAAEFE